MPQAASRRKPNPPRAAKSGSSRNGATSIIESTRVPIECSPRVIARGKHAARRLPFHMQRQLRSNWCWAAVAASVARFYQPDVDLTQGDVAKKQLGRRKVGKDRGNKIGHLKHSLKIVRHAKNPPELKRPLPFEKAQEEIDAGRPICVRTVWRGSQMGHFLAIVGYHKDCELLTIADPRFGTSHWHYRAFRDDYRHSGQWKTSYCTKR
jgi:hypothetical protein